MDVLEALGGWRNINREKLDQIKVDNPPLYDAITKALNLLAKKYGGEDIVIEKPIEKPIEVVSEVEQGYDFTGLWPYADYLRMIEGLTEKKGNWVTVDDIVKEKGVPKIFTPQEYYDSQIVVLNALQKNGLILNVDNEYKLSNKGKVLLIKANGEPIQTQPTEEPVELSNQLTNRQFSVLQAVESASKIWNGFVGIFEIWQNLMGPVPINYQKYKTKTNPSLEQDLALLAFYGYLEFAALGVKPEEARYNLSQKGKNILSATNTLIDLKDFVEAQPEEEPTQGLNYRRPSPLESATLFDTGTTKIGNDGNQWRVTENKNGVKRWVKINEKPIPAIGEPPISEIEEDEVDLDILEQQLDDDSLEFDISDEDLDNLEF